MGSLSLVPLLILWGGWGTEFHNKLVVAICLFGLSLSSTFGADARGWHSQTLIANLLLPGLRPLCRLKTKNTPFPTSLAAI